MGEPGCGYPWPWGVSRWLTGEVATVAGLSGTAVPLAEFLLALQHIPAGMAPATSQLSDRDRATRATIAELADTFDATVMTSVWQDALAAPPWPRPPVWFHGDFHTGNLLTHHGRLSAVIDFGSLGAGDPARDLTIAFTLLSPPARAEFREALGTDDATWARGRGWALTTGLNAYRSYAAVSPRVAAQTTRQITAALTG